MADKWKTFTVACQGGLIQNIDVLEQAMKQPGSAITLTNFEPSIKGGYRRISGYSKFNTNEVSVGSTAVVSGTTWGTGVFSELTTILAARGTNFYSAAAGSGSWTKINTDARSAFTRARFYRYDMAKPYMAIVDGVNYPAKWDGTTFTQLSGAPIGSKYVCDFKSCLVLSGYGAGDKVTFSAPNADTNYSAGAGAIEINVGDIVQQIRAFRDELYIFCKNRIFKIVGDAAFNFRLVSVTSNFGCIAPDSVQELGGDLLFLAPDGVRPVSATARLSDIELTSVSKAVLPSMSTFISTYQGQYISTCVIRGKNQYRLFGWKAGDSQPANIAFLGFLDGKSNVGDENNLEWSQISGIQATAADSGFLSGVETVVHAGTDGYIYQQESGTSFNSANILAQFQTPYLVFDDPTFRKVIFRISIFNEIEGAFNFTINPILDYNDSTAIQPPAITISGGTGFATYDGAATYDTTYVYDVIQSPKLATQTIGSGLSIGFLFSSNDTNASYTIKSLAIEYGLGGRR